MKYRFFLPARGAGLADEAADAAPDAPVKIFAALFFRWRYVVTRCGGLAGGRMQPGLAGEARRLPKRY